MGGFVLLCSRLCPGLRSALWGLKSSSLSYRECLKNDGKVCFPTTSAFKKTLNRAMIGQ